MKILHINDSFVPRGHIVSFKKNLLFTSQSLVGELKMKTLLQLGHKDKLASSDPGLCEWKRHLVNDSHISITRKKPHKVTL